MFGQEGCVNIDGSEWKGIQKTLRQNLPVGHHHGTLSPKRPDMFDDLLPFYALRLIDRNTKLLGKEFYRRSTELLSPPARAIGLSDDKPNPGPGISQHPQGRDCKIGSPHKDETG
jgi:hypothetical protein